MFLKLERVKPIFQLAAASGPNTRKNHIISIITAISRKKNSEQIRYLSVFCFCTEVRLDRVRERKEKR